MLPIIVDNSGNTLVDSAGQPVNVALNWIDEGLQNFENWIVQTLLS